jgi:molybdate transport system substrate-binding protein
VPLVGVDARDAFLQNINLARANLRRCNLSGADMRGASLERADVDNSELVAINLRGANLRGADFTDTNLGNADLSGADLADAVLDRADLSAADLSGIVNWQSIRSMAKANIWKVEHAPDGFAGWATGRSAVALAAADPDNAQPITVSAAISLKETLEQIARDYHDQSGRDVKLNLGASGTLAAQIKQGAPADLFISADREQVDILVNAGLADADSRREIARNRLVLIVPKDSPNPPTKFADLLDDRFVHVAMGEPKVVPAGLYAMQTLKSLGLYDKLSAKLVMGQNVRQVLSYVVRGEADAGLVYATDAKAAGDSVKLAAVADESSHEPIVYPAVILNAGNHQAAQDFLNFLASAKARAVFTANGFSLPSDPARRD